MEQEQDDLGYVARTMMNMGMNSQSQWQVDPSDIRLFVEESLKGQRTITTTRILYKVTEGEEEKYLTGFYAEDDEEAQELFEETMQRENLNPLNYTLQKTQKIETTTVSKPIKDALVNATGAYHLLSIIETIFSRIGYMSKLDSNEINNIAWDDVLVPLVTSMMVNHVKYGIKKGSRNEILGLILSTTFLILKSSTGGWTGDRFAGAVKETIYSTGEPQRNKKWGVL